jgi:hypothetical protein
LIDIKKYTAALAETDLRYIHQYACTRGVLRHPWY